MTRIPERALGYVVRKTVVVTLRDLDGFEAFLGDTLEHAAAHAHGIEFRTTEPRAHRDEARSLAVRAALEEALAMATELGQTVTDPFSIREEYSGWWSPYSSWWGGRSSGVSQNVVQQVGESGYTGDGAVAPGQIVATSRNVRPEEPSGFFLQ